MTNRKNTRRALVLSLLSLLVCCTMLVGTTFAWFTDSVTSGNNQIIAGNLDIELEYSLDMSEGSWKTVNNATDLFSDTLWEPGHTQVVYLRLKNVGTLALKYEFAMNYTDTVIGTSVEGNEIKLSEHLMYDIVDVAAAYDGRDAARAAVEATAETLAAYYVSGKMLAGDDAKTMALVVYMPETVGNEANYRGDAVPQIDLGINLFATQYTYEEDSFDETYDDPAPLRGKSIKVRSGAELVAAAADTDVSIIEVMNDITLDSEVALPAGVTLKGNGHQINGTVYAGGDLTIADHVKVTSFSATYYDRTITIGKGACLEVTGTGRVSLAYGNVFNITGRLIDAKTADKTDVQPSLIIPGGISITGGSDAAMNVTDAYVKIGNATSKDKAANGTFDLNFTNSIVEFTDQLTFAEPTGGMNPTFNVNVKNSVLTTGTKFIIAAPKSNVVIDNSVVNVATYVRNSGNLTLKKGSKLTGATIQFGENGGNNGIINVDASELTVNASSTGSAFDGKGTGAINLTNGAVAAVDYYKAMTVTVDATSTFTGTEVQ